MNKSTASTSEDSDDTTLTPQELHVLSELDSRQFGYLMLNQPSNSKKRAIVEKAIKYLQSMIIQAHRQKRAQLESGSDKENSKPISIDPKTWVKLGHFHLLLEEYEKALSAYQRFYRIHKDNHWQDATFLYGLGMCYFHFNAFQWATKAFQELLYVVPGFQRANEVHLRLGLMFKVTSETESALKHLQLSLVDNSPCTASNNTSMLSMRHEHAATILLYNTMFEAGLINDPVPPDAFYQEWTGDLIDTNSYSDILNTYINTGTLQHPAITSSNSDTTPSTSNPISELSQSFSNFSVSDSVNGSSESNNGRSDDVEYSFEMIENADYELSVLNLTD